MQDLNDKVTGGTLSAGEFNEPMSELQNLIVAVGQSLTSGDLNQLNAAVASYAGAADYYTDSGVLNAYLLDVVGSKAGPVALDADHDGLFARFRPGNANTGASTANVATLGVQDIRREDNSVLQANDLVTTQDALMRYEHSTTNWRLLNFVIGATLTVPRGYIDGFITGLGDGAGGGDQTNDINWGVGLCRDDADAATMQISTAGGITKQIDVDWTAGDDQGGFPSGLTLAEDWYHLFVIRNTVTGTIDAGFDNNLAATNLLADAAAETAGYTQFRRVGSVLTSPATFNIIAYRQVGDSFYWRNAGFQDINVDPGTDVQVTHTLAHIPDGPRVLANVSINFHTPTGNGQAFHVYAGGDETLATTPSITYHDARTNGDGRDSQATALILTNILAQIKTRSNIAATDDLTIQTHGWQDFRGQNEAT